MPKAKPLDAKQERFLRDLEKGEKTVDLIFQDHVIPPEELEEWLGSRRFMRAIDVMRGRMQFRLDQELCRGAMVGGERLSNSVAGEGGFAKPVELQACVNAIKLFHALVRNPKLKEQAAQLAAGLSPGYHPNVTPERAQALLRRLQKRRDRDDRLDRDQDENGKWMSAD